nr:DUF2501 domain-containing protein [Halomonas socia]
MDMRHARSIAIAGLASLLSLGHAHAVSLDGVRDQAGGMMSGGDAGLLSSLSSGSFNFASLENLTGVLSYCQENGYLGSNADIVKGQVMDRLGVDSEPEQDDDYQQGLEGILQGDGEAFSLSSLGDQAGERACGLVADQAMSFVGG